MDDRQILGAALILGATLLASVSQVLLKRSANMQHAARYAEYLNVFVISGYFLLFCTTIINVFALRWVPLSLAVALDASGQIFVPLLSRIFLGEDICRKKILGMVVIIIGISIFSIPV